MPFSPPTQSFCLLAIDVLKDSHFTFRLVICVVEEEDDDDGGGECGVVELRFTDTVTWILIGWVVAERSSWDGPWRRWTVMWEHPKLGVSAWWWPHMQHPVRWVRMPPLLLFCVKRHLIPPVCDRSLGSEFTDFASDVDAVAGVMDRGTETLYLPTSTTPS